MFGRPAMTFRPCVTNARLSPCSEATSATVPSATRSSRSMSFGSARSAKKPRAAKLADQRDAEQEGHADRGEMAMRGAVARFVEPVGIDQRVGDAAAGSRIGDGRRRSRRARRLAPAPAPRTPARRNRRVTISFAPRCSELDQRFARRAIALHQPVGDVDDRLARRASRSSRTSSAALVAPSTS